jgi:hypothetical protein
MSWFDSYFSNRWQGLLITNIHIKHKNFSTWEEMEHVVLQGSVLGPLWLLPDLHDWPRIISNKKNNNNVSR